MFVVYKASVRSRPFGKGLGLGSRWENSPSKVNCTVV